MKKHLVDKNNIINYKCDGFIYCYGCENDVKDENLFIHLIKFFNDINVKKKNEKLLE